MNYFCVFLVAVAATAANAQRPLCWAQGCAASYSDSNIRTSKCCQNHLGNFNECCRTSCNFGKPCN
ncbi:PcF and SCR74-like cys-rich secreted peptide [Phytophthora megakarya]|uniref:PcF and SCR74-like cys-rich secreted peptide n=1 Tax=Phytophthora megakarya TaxID=4795 RepID=A0A225VS16_9STRA|nr:PcF and SCR74-like cys-rich secreted peptide [Phytophthora megakarya]